jgi:hypothetical protein
VVNTNKVLVALYAVICGGEGLVGGLIVLCAVKDG